MILPIIIFTFIAIPSGLGLARLSTRFVPLSRHSKQIDDVLSKIIVACSTMILSLFLRGKLPISSIAATVTGILFGSHISVIGLTGSIASGKSTASSYLVSCLGYEVIDADKIARDVLIDLVTGEIDRGKLGSIVFANPSKRRKLERITHPRIVFRIICDIVRHRIMGRRVVIDVPLLFESPNPLLRFLCRTRVLIDVDYETQKRRIRIRNPELPDDQIDARIRSQMLREQKLKLADVVIYNDGSLDELYAQLNEYFR
jgi:dephospho-CoA kinase